MNRNRFIAQSRRTAAGIGVIAGGTFVAAMMSLGAAPAAFAAPTGSVDSPFVDTTPNPDGYSDLFGGTGTTQGSDDASLDTQLFQQNPADALAFDTSVIRFEDNNDHPITDLINALDPSAFQYQFDPDITGTMAGGTYLIPDDGLGYLAVELDAFLLNGLGLSAALGPVIDILLGSPPF